MIITTQKSIEEIMKYLAPYSNILIVGCGTCATEVQTGGEKQVGELADRLRGRWFVETMMIEAPCDARLARRDWRKIKRSGKDFDALLILGCGAGVQTLSDVVDLPCFPGLETHFLGKVERIGLYYERCKACGECYLGETAGICPVTRWVLIWKRLKKQGRMEFFRKIRSPKQFGLQAYPRGIDAIPSHMKIKKNPLLGPDETVEIIMKAVKELNSKH
jgi:ferredoxin